MGELGSFFSDLSEKERSLIEEILTKSEDPSIFIPCKQVREIIPIDKWLEDSYYVGEDGAHLYDYWKEQLKDTFSPRRIPYTEVIVTGGIGGGKSTYAIYAMLRKLYEISCYQNIASKFGLMSTAYIVFIYFTVSKTQALLTGYGQFRETVDSIPYFNECFKRNKKIDSLLKFPEKVLFTYGSGAGHVIGMNLLGSILDEANFFQGESSSAPNSTSQFEYSKISKMYSSILNRAKSRFVKDGTDPSLSVLVSSATHQSSFTEQRIKQGVEDPTVKIINAKIWEAKPKGTYSSKSFWVFKGSDMLDPFLVDTVADVKTYLETCPVGTGLDVQGESLDVVVENLPEEFRERFLKVPQDFRKPFEVDIVTSLQDIGGESVAPKGKLFTSRLHYGKAIVPGLEHPFIKEAITVSTNSSVQVFNFLKRGVRFDKSDAPHYIHIDQSTTTDCTGFAMVHIDRVKTDFGVRKPVVRADIILQIQPPRAPQKISIAKVREFVLFLRDIVNINIKKVTYDQAFSAESIQVLNEKGIEAELLSVDRTDEQYRMFANLLYEGLLEMYDYRPFQKELFDLIHDRSRRKVDHPDGSCLMPWTEVYVCGEGLIEVEKLVGREGLRTLSVDGTGKVDFGNVLRVWKTGETREYCKVMLSNGSSFDVTGNHPVLTKERGYVSAEKLAVGEVLKSFGVTGVAERKIFVVGVSVCKCSMVPIYDMEMEGEPNFSLGCGVFVHNSKDVADAFVGAVYNALSDPLHEAFSEESDVDMFLRANRSVEEISEEMMFGGIDL